MGFESLRPRQTNLLTHRGKKALELQSYNTSRNFRCCAMAVMVLVTGAAGFIGSNLTERLLEQGCEVVGLDNLSSGNRLNLAEALRNARFKFVEGDLSDLKTTREALGKCTLIFHLAADPEVQRGSQDPNRQLKQNLLATFNLLEAIRIRKMATRLFFASTSTVYGEPALIPTPEGYGPLLPISVYGATKLGCEALIAAYVQLVPLEAIVFRFANVVGTRAGHGVIVDFIKKLRRNRSELEVLGDGSQSKSYLHIDDCVDAFLLGLDDSFWRPGVEVFNIGTEDRTNVLEIAQIVIRAMGLSGVAIRTSPGPDGRGWAGDVKTMQLDIAKIRKRGWRPTKSSGEAVQLACEQLISQEP